MIQIYTGNGKGKTTAALGLALRASGAGLKVYILQFIKGKAYSEFKALKKIKNISIEQCGRGCFIKSAPRAKDIACAQLGLKKAEKILAAKRYDLVVLDEINVAVHLKLLNVKDILALMRNCPSKTELILTGRHAPEALIKKADLVSEIKEIKHYFHKGCKARSGIEL